MKTTAGTLPALAALLAVVSSLPAAAPAVAATPAPVSSSARLIAVLRSGAETAGQTAAPPATAPAAKFALPDGPGKAEAERVCSACHAPNVFTHQRHDQAGWSTIVNQMIAKGADGSDEDFAKILSYLTTNFGPDVPVPASPAAPAPATPPAAASH